MTRQSETLVALKLCFLPKKQTRGGIHPLQIFTISLQCASGRETVAAVCREPKTHFACVLAVDHAPPPFSPKPEDFPSSWPCISICDFRRVLRLTQAHTCSVGSTKEIVPVFS